MKDLLFSLCLLLSCDHLASAFVNRPPSKENLATITRRPVRGWLATERPDSSSSSSNASSTKRKDALWEELRSMKIRDLKKELMDQNQPVHDVFEKEQLVQRLYQLRCQSQASSSPPPSFRKTSHASAVEQSYVSSRTSKGMEAAVVEVPLYFCYMDRSMRVAAVNGGGITVEGSSQPYATITATVNKDNSGMDTNKEVPSLNFLLDTACSGLVIRPSVVERWSLPRLSTPVTMTGAATTTTQTGLTQFQQIQIGTHTFSGPIPAAVQDIGALPRDIDGIMGFSLFWQAQFEGVDLDFKDGTVRLYKTLPPLPTKTATTTTAEATRNSTSISSSTVDPSKNTEPEGDGSNSTSIRLISQADLRLQGSYGIYSTPVFLGQRGPVEMLVDTGASSTLLSWKGVASLGLSRNDRNVVQPLISRMGAIGSDNVALELTHRIYVSSIIHVGTRHAYPGIDLKCRALRLPIDIGNIPILEQLPGANVGGILGIDVLMQCDLVRIIRLPNSKLQLLLFVRQNGENVGH